MAGHDTRFVRETNLGLQRKECSFVLQQNDGLARKLGHEIASLLDITGALYAVTVEDLQC